MAGGFNKGKDSLEISELAALNDDISDEFIAQLHQQLTQSLAHATTESISIQLNPNDDTTLFEEPVPAEQQDVQQDADAMPPAEESAMPVPQEVPPPIPAAPPTPQPISDVADNKADNEEKNANNAFEDSFIKKYKAKLNKKNNPEDYADDPPAVAQTEEPAPDGNIEQLSNGNIIEKHASQEQKDYNSSLDFLDSNVKYSKYVIYIDPQNVDFIEGLTVKERKNLINNILRQQDDIAQTKQRFKVMRNLFIHVLITVIVFSVTIPLVYSLINASLEATIDNHRRSQSNWQTLYKPYGKIPAKN